MSSLDASFLLRPLDSSSPLPDIVDECPTPDIVVAYFDCRYGPRPLSATSPSFTTEDLAARLFPAEWNSGSIFAFQFGAHYCLAIGAIATLVQHARGSTHVSIGLLSPKPVFGQDFHTFLRHCVNFFTEQPSLDFDRFLEFGQTKQLLSNARFLASHPYFPFTQTGSCCRAFSGRSGHLLAIWRARLLGLRICFGATRNIVDATNVAYFIGAIALPIRPLDGCAFHIDMADVDFFRQGDWKVCSVTHVLLQGETVADLSIGPDGNLRIRGDQSWIRNGKGEIVRTLDECLRGGSDEQLFRVFLRLNAAVRERCERREFELGTIGQLGLDSGNRRFFRQYLAGLGLALGDDAGSCCC
jgi:hypothetical protein